MHVSHNPNASSAKLQNSEEVEGISGDTIVGDIFFGKNKGTRGGGTTTECCPSVFSLPLSVPLLSSLSFPSASFFSAFSPPPDSTEPIVS